MSEITLPENIYFIELPKKIDLGPAVLLPEIPIPVEFEQGQNIDVSNLRPEMIVSAMLRVLAAQPNHAHAGYYRNIVQVLYPKVADELSREGVMRAREADFEIAEHIFSALAGLEPEDARHVLNLAVLCEDWAAASAKNGDSEREATLHEKAHAYYERLLRWEPPLADAYYNAAYFYAGQGAFERAMSLFTTFISLTDDTEKQEKAQKALEKLKERSSSDDLFKEAFDAIRLGQEEKSIALVSSFIQKEPDVWNAWFLLGWAYRRLGRFAEGYEALERAIALGAAMVDVYNELSICAMELEKYQECRKYLELALRLEPENTKIISNLGVLSHKMGNLRDAIGFFATVLELDPTDQLAQSMLKTLKD